MFVVPRDGLPMGQSCWVTPAVMKHRVTWLAVMTASTMWHEAGDTGTHDKQAVC